MGDSCPLTDENTRVRGVLVQGLTGKDFEFLDYFEGSVSLLYFVRVVSYNGYVGTRCMRNVTSWSFLFLLSGQ